MVDQVRVAFEYLPHAMRDHSIAYEIRRDKDCAGTQAFRSYCRHGRAHTESPGFIGSGAHDRSAALPSDNHGLAAQLRIIPLLYRSIKGVHVYVDDFSDNHLEVNDKYFRVRRNDPLCEIDAVGRLPSNPLNFDMGQP
jgi:hypothetical protein